MLAFLVAAPAVGIEATALNWTFLGAELTLARLFGGVVLAILVGGLASRFDRYLRSSVLREHASDDPDQSHLGLKGFARAFDELLLHVAPWMVVGLIAAAYVQTLMPAEQVITLTRLGLDVPLMIVVAIPTYLGAATATPLAAVLLSKGVSPGAVVAGLVIGPALNLAVISFLRRTSGSRMTWVILGVSVAVALGMAYAINAVFHGAPRLEPPAEHGHGIIAIASAVTVLAFTARNLWQTGLRAWVSSLLGISPNDGEPAHGHGHHGHVH